MTRIVVGSPNLTQSLLLYPGLGPAMLEQHRRSFLKLHFRLRCCLLNHALMNMLSIMLLGSSSVPFTVVRISLEVHFFISFLEPPFRLRCCLLNHALLHMLSKMLLGSSFIPFTVVRISLEVHFTMLFDDLSTFGLSRNRVHPLLIYIFEVIFSQQMID
jgi:hypothetical protein